MAVIVTVVQDGEPFEQKYENAARWHIDDHLTLHVIGATGGAGPFADQGGNIASYACGSWESARLSN